MTKDARRRRKRPPKKNVLVRSLLQVTTTLYSMAGLGSLEQSKAFKDIRKTESIRSPTAKTVQEDAEKDIWETAEVKHFIESSKRKESSHLPDNMLALNAKELDILLVESDTIWMLNLPGTCVEVDPDAKDRENGEEKTEEEENSDRNVSRYERVESWSQTLDFTKKKKGTQCDDIDVNEATTQVSTKNFLDEEKKRKKLLSTSGGGDGRSPLPSQGQ